MWSRFLFLAASRGWRARRRRRRKLTSKSLPSRRPRRPTRLPLRRPPRNANSRRNRLPWTRKRPRTRRAPVKKRSKRKFARRRRHAAQARRSRIPGGEPAQTGQSGTAAKAPRNRRNNRRTIRPRAILARSRRTRRKRKKTRPRRKNPRRRRLRDSFRRATRWPRPCTTRPLAAEMRKPPIFPPCTALSPLIMNLQKLTAGRPHTSGELVFAIDYGGAFVGAKTHQIVRAPDLDAAAMAGCGRPDPFRCRRPEAA